MTIVLYPPKQTSVVLFVLCCAEISQETAVNPVDIVSTLQSLQMLKYWKGKHLVLKRQVTTQTTIALHIQNYYYLIFSHSLNVEQWNRNAHCSA